MLKQASKGKQKNPVYWLVTFVYSYPFQHVDDAAEITYSAGKALIPCPRRGGGLSLAGGIASEKHPPCLG